MPDFEKFHGLSLPSQYAPDIVRALTAARVETRADASRSDHAVELLQEARRVESSRRRYPYVNKMTDIELLPESGQNPDQDISNPLLKSTEIPPAFIFMGIPEAKVLHDGLAIREQKLREDEADERWRQRDGSVVISLYGLIARREADRLAAISDMVVEGAAASQDKVYRIIDASHADPNAKSEPQHWYAQ